MRENGAQCAEVQEEIAISSGCSVHRAEDNQLGMICERSDFHGAKLSLRLREGLDLGTAGSTGVLVLREEEKFGSAHSSQRSSILHAPVNYRRPLYRRGNWGFIQGGISESSFEKVQNLASGQQRF
jgi:hypothetical protein